MKLKQFALVISLVVFGTQCNALTRKEAQNQPLNEQQQEAVVSYVSQLFNDTTATDINWYCFAGAIAQFINEHKQIAHKPEIDKRFKDLAVVLNSTSSSSRYIPYVEMLVGLQLKNYKDLFANNPQVSPKDDSEILRLLKNRINYESKESCKDNLIDVLYCIAHPDLCKRSMPSSQAIPTTSSSSYEEDDIQSQKLEELAKILKAKRASDDDL
jgi:hypothetical protein